jgi:hypothetical protein
MHACVKYIAFVNNRNYGSHRGVSVLSVNFATVDFNLQYVNVNTNKV